MREVLKIVEMENAKREAQTKKQQEQRQKLVKKVDQELETKIEVIREKRQNNEAYEKELEANQGLMQKMMPPDLGNLKGLFS